TVGHLLDVTRRGDPRVNDVVDRKHPWSVRIKLADGRKEELVKL
ncbi:hypothetical protein TSMEX_008893, partial [Taenia solium]